MTAEGGSIARVTGYPSLLIEETSLGKVYVEAATPDPKTGFSVRMAFDSEKPFEEVVAEFLPYVEAEWPDRRCEVREPSLDRPGRSIRWTSNDPITMTIEATS